MSATTENNPSALIMRELCKEITFRLDFLEKHSLTSRALLVEQIRQKIADLSVMTSFLEEQP